MQNETEWTREDLKCAKVAQGGQKWPRGRPRVDHRGAEMYYSLPKWPNGALHGPEIPRVAQRGPEGPEETREAQRGPEKPREAQRGQNGPEEPRRAQKGLKWTVVARSGLK